MQTKFYRFEQLKIDGFFINNSKVAENIIIEAESLLMANTKLNSILYKYSRYNATRWQKALGEQDYTETLQISELNDRPAVVYHKNNSIQHINFK